MGQKFASGKGLASETTELEGIDLYYLLGLDKLLFDGEVHV